MYIEMNHPVHTPRFSQDDTNRNF